MSGNGFNDTMADWEGLLSAVEANRSEIPSSDVFAAQLAAAVQEVQAIRARKSALRSEARELTKSLVGGLELGNDLVIRLRSWVRAWYGPHNEKLTEFGVKPIRKRGRYGRKSAPTGAEDEAPQNPTSTVR
jgi:hypothetical protein